MLILPWGIYVLVTLILLAAVRSSPGAFMATVASLSALAALRLLGERSLHGISYTRKASETRLFCGEQVDLTLSLVNARRWPASWVTVRDRFPRNLQPVRGADVGAAATYELEWTLPVGSRQSTSYTRSFRCLHRGIQQIGSASLESGDPFGLVRRERQINDRLRLIVYPRLLPLVAPQLPAARPMGERAARGWLFPDHSFYGGVRPYTAGDPLHHVHWRASARAGQLQTKTYQPSLGHQLVIVLSVDTLPQIWMGQRDACLETAVMTAASLARDAIDHGDQVSLIANGASPGVRGGARVPPGTGYDHLRTILEALATMSAPGVCALSELIARNEADLPLGATVVTVAACTDDAALWRLASLQQHGHRVCLVEVGCDHLSSAAPQVARLRVGEEERWRERSEIVLV